MTPFQFRVNPRTLSEIVWTELLSDLDLAIPHISQRLTTAWDACDATRGKMAYNTGSISPSSGLALYAFSRRFAPKEIFEVGTFIGRSTVSMALGAEDGGQQNAVLYTCDGSNDFHVPHAGPTRIVGFPRKMSHEALGAVASQSQGIDLFHLDGRIGDADLPHLQRLTRPHTCYAIDDFEGAEKGVSNVWMLRQQPWMQAHVLVYPPDRALLARFGLHSGCSTAMLVPGPMFRFSNQ